VEGSIGIVFTRVKTSRKRMKRRKTAGGQTRFGEEIQTEREERLGWRFGGERKERFGGERRCNLLLNLGQKGKNDVEGTLVCDHGEDTPWLG